MYFVPSPLSAETFVSAAVRVVLPWSTWPIVPTFTCGLVRSNFAFAIALAFHFRNDFFGLGFRYFLIVAEFHAVNRTPLAHRPQRRGIAEHLGQRDTGRDDVRVGALRHAADLAAPRRQVADDVAHVVGRRNDFDVHDRLQQNRMRLTRRFFHRHRAGDLERHFARVDVVERAIHQLHLHVHHGIAGQHAVLQRLFHTLLDGADVFLGNRAANDVVLEHEARPGLPWLEVDDDVAVLAAPTRLADELAFDVLDAFADRFAVGHLRAAHVGVDLELPPHALDDDLEVQLAHAADDRLGGLGIGVHAERRIFLGQLREGDAQLVLVRLRLRLDGDGDDGVREAHRLENDGVRLVAQRIAGARVLQPDRGGDVAGAHLFDLFALVGVHLQQPADALFAVLGAVVDVGARAQHARVHAEERQFPDVRIGHDLERERGERRVVRRRPLGMRRVVMRQMPLDRRDIHRRRQVIHDRVEQRLDALVLERGATDHGDDGAGDGGFADDGADLFFGQLVVFEILVQDGVVRFDAGLDHFVSQLCDLLFHRRGDRAFDVRLPHRLVVVDDLDFAHQIDEPRKQLA